MNNETIAAPEQDSKPADGKSELNAGLGMAEYDLSKVIPLTHRKTKDIIARDGFSVTGFVLTKDSGEKCIVDMSAVRWLSRNEFFKMMHPDA